MTRALLAALQRAGLAPLDGPATAVGGRSISRALRLETQAGSIMLKLEPSAAADRLETEAESLAALAGTDAVPVPAVLACGMAESEAYLALEWINFGAKTAEAQARLGRALAQMHRTRGDAFGWTRDNYIGRTPQPNPRTERWIDFFREHRLAFQLELARRNGLGIEAAALGDALLDGLERFFEQHAPEPSLLHGDLWGGNWGATAAAVPYLFDPAAYYGDREADLAMTRLFGGFGEAFHRAYDEAWPPSPGRGRRVALYNLYHLLNHFNLFGGGYRNQVLAVLRRLVS